jgi:hypothetical protein
MLAQHFIACDTWAIHPVMPIRTYGKKQPETGVSYYSYILIYVDDNLCIHHEAMPVLDKLNQ